ncbi:response regulator [Conexibacter sp. W3-3-2]|uniref:Response regulator n=1 Tax=Paraconexibacter algicola TaxID=2133960 RepID=A0A2T4UMG0_9ACTN|nr:MULTISPECIES: response regulator [Solirubrobacterales]MTD46723.1 response regulator [Conexibacter sp. W3-3-2]PTL60420.1 response regulator [Paraconexibacter algicola]
MSLVLVADDDRDIVLLVQIALERAGHEVVVAHDGEAAWEVVRDRTPDIAVLDVMMPRLDGLALTRRLRAHPPTATLPVLVVSAAVQDRDLRAAREAGADGHVRKPFSPKSLVAQVDALLRR